jgi:tRNA(Arg) A34 adenosine deaminase TadA
VSAGLWTALTPPWQICLDDAWRACRAGSVPVGAGVAAADGRLLARGRNQQGRRDNGTGLVRDHPLAHAELNALLACDEYDWDGTQAPHTLLEPCLLCLGAFYMSGIRELHFAARDPGAGSTNLLGTTAYFRRKPIRLHPPNDPRLESLVIALLTEHACTVRGERAGEFVAGWRETLGAGVALGEALFRGGELAALRDADASTARMVDAIAVRLDGVA